MKPKCHKCKKEVSNTDKICIHCGADLKTRRKAVGFGCLFFIILLIGIGTMMAVSDSDPEPELTSAQKRTQEIENCLSAWDGSHPALERKIKASLNDEDSYKHVETVYIDNDSIITILTRFSAKNAFGGVIKREVMAEINNNCELVTILKWYE